MAELTIKQYLHRPNATELGIGNTNETYLSVSTDFDLSDIFPPKVEVDINEISQSKIYKLKSAKNGNEFRINQLGPFYRDFSVLPGDEIIITECLIAGQRELTIRVNNYKRTVLYVDSKRRVEILGIDNLQGYATSSNSYSFNVNDNEILSLSFDKKEKKRKDSPDLTDFYKAELNGVSLEKGDYYVTFGENISLANLKKSEYGIVRLNDSDLFDKSFNKSAKMVKSLSPVILYGPPGTGKTFKMQTKYISKFAKENRREVTFHQSFSYEEFVEGLKPCIDFEEGSDDIKYRIEDGIFKEACKRAAVLADFDSLGKCLNATFEERNQAFDNAINNGKIVLLCIDEINRGNVAAIFGDLISLIETNKRLGVNKETEMTVKLPYSKEEFGVPANLLIVGTMNTADRSIQLLDTALRRRFKFEELLPQYDKIKNENAVAILKNINARIRCLLNKDNQIGHAYFIHAKNDSEIFSIMINKVIPLLEEYFYNDTEKIRFVLNEDGNVEKSFYIEDEEAKAVYNLYNKEGIDEDKSFYVLNEELKQLSDEDKCSEYLANLLNK